MDVVARLLWGWDARIHAPDMFGKVRFIPRAPPQMHLPRLRSCFACRGAAACAGMGGTARAKRLSGSMLTAIILACGLGPTF